MNIDILTCTNQRPICLDLCKSYVKMQTYANINHIIADGGEIWENMLNGLSECKGDAVVIFEDDDFYPPDWTSLCVKYLNTFDIVGQRLAYMYHVPTGNYGIKVPSNGHSSLHSTAFKKDLIPFFVDIIKEHQLAKDPILDKDLWQKSTHLKQYLIDSKSVITMKSMPGKKGYSLKHNPNRLPHHDDSNRSVLRRWVGDAHAENYLRIINEHLV